MVIHRQDPKDPRYAQDGQEYRHRFSRKPRKTIMHMKKSKRTMADIAIMIADKLT